MSAFPPSLIAARVRTLCDDFLRWFGGWVEQLGGSPVTIRSRSEQSRSTRHLDITWQPPTDGLGIVRMHLRGIPGPVALRFPGDDGVDFADEHRAEVLFPPDYPERLVFRLRLLTPSAHPRLLPPEENAPACLLPTGELDGALRQVLDAVMLKPSSVLPPSQFPGVDKGYRPELMDQIEVFGPDRLYQLTLDRFRERLQTRR